MILISNSIVWNKPIENEIMWLINFSGRGKYKTLHVSSHINMIKWHHQMKYQDVLNSHYEIENVIIKHHFYSYILEMQTCVKIVNIIV